MTVTKRHITEMETYTGKHIDLRNPKPEQICLEDIAVGLSNVCRFGGQVSRFYSVAEHCIRVSESFARPRLRLLGLLHDAHEAYTNDIVAPLKYALCDDNGYSELKDIQHDLDWAIRDHFEIATPSVSERDMLKAVDDAVMFREAAALKRSGGVGEHWGNTEAHQPFDGCGWEPVQAKYRFIETYRRLTNATH